MNKTGKIQNTSNSSLIKGLSVAALMSCAFTITPIAYADTQNIDTDKLIITETNNKISGETYQNIQNSEINMNYWGVAGGAVQNTSTNLEVENSTFTNNSVILNAAEAYNWQTAKGGAIYNAADANINSINNSTFTGNSATVNTTTSPGNSLSSTGGAIHNDGTIKVIEDSTFESNIANYGGAIYNSTNAEIDSISNVSFISNSSTASYSGAGAIWNAGTINKIENSTFTNNSGGQGAQDIFNSGTINAINNTSFVNNTSAKKLIINDSGTIGSINGAKFNNNNFTDNVIYSWGGTIGEIANSEITQNTSTYPSQAFVMLQNGATLNSISSVTYSNNGMNAINAQNSTIGDILKSTFSDNTSSSAVISLFSSDLGNISDSEFSNNTNSWAISASLKSTGDVNKIGSIDNTSFINNNGAIRLDRYSVGDISNSTFKNNSSYSGTIFIQGDSFSKVTMGTISNSLFESNYSNSYGGALASCGNVEIAGISGTTFKGNHSNNIGGAITLLGTSKINYISDTNFEDNYTSGQGGGGAIVISGNTQIGDMTNVLFKNNNAGSSVGGAIAVDSGSIGNLTNVSFDGNYAAGIGGAIYNNGTIGNWTDGYAYGAGEAHTSTLGALLWNGGTFGDITNVAFKDCYSQSSGGAIANSGTLGNITNATFTNNHSKSASGGAINNTAKLGKISNSLFENNSAANSGGAIASNGTINGIENSEFNNNSGLNGGALYLTSSAGALSNLSFTGNSALGTTYSEGKGGAIWSSVGVNLTGTNTFINNSAKYYGGAIYSTSGSSALNLDNSYFKGNSAGYLGGAVVTFSNISSIENSSFISNIVGQNPFDETEGTNTQGSGGAIWLSGSIDTIKNSYFEGNKTLTTYDDRTAAAGHGGAIYSPQGISNIIDTTFKNNSAGNDGGAIWTTGKLNIQNSLFDGNKANTVGGAILNYGTLSIKNSSFINNSATLDRGGAIYATGNVELIADGGDVIFRNNTDVTGKNDIYLNSGDEINLDLSAVNNGKIELSSGVDSSNVYLMKINGDKSGSVYINADINNAKMTIDNTNVYMNTPSYITSNPSVAVNSGTLNFASLANQTYNFKNLSNSGTINIASVDVDPAAGVMGRLSADSYGDISKGIINVADLNILTDPIKAQTNIAFADTEFAKTVQYSGKKEYYSPIYKYDVNYLPGSGEFVFVRGNGDSIGDFNPAVTSASVSAQVGSQATITETFKYVFEHADAFTQIPATDRFAAINKNTYAAASTDFDQNMSYISGELNNSGIWVRPYTSFESMHLNKGPKADVVSYGTLIGYDSDFRKLKHGWANIGTGYVGYNGSQIRYNNSDTTTNGGMLGLTETFYKGNFWTAVTLSTGASVGESHNLNGTDNFTSLMAGIGSKTGYNFEFKGGKFIIQPIWFMSYTFINTFDYTTTAGVKINNDPMHTIQLNPSVRFIGNTKTGWQPYASVGMVWNLLNESNTTANGVKLPETYIKPYVEYGVGLQKRWADKYSAFLQAMLRNGGRNGISLTAGFRWAIGKEGTPIQKVQKEQNVSNITKTSTNSNAKSSETTQWQTTKNKTVIKQIQPKTSSRTANKGIIKAL